MRVLFGHLAPALRPAAPALPAIPPLAPSTTRALHATPPARTVLPWAQKPSTRDPRKLRAGAKRTGHPGPRVATPRVSSRTLDPLLATPSAPNPPAAPAGDLAAALAAAHGPLPAGRTPSSGDPDGRVPARRAAEARAAAAAGLPLPALPGSDPAAPHLRGAVQPDEARFALADLPAATAAASPDPRARARADERAELVRRVGALENAGARDLRRWNFARAVGIFGRGHSDTGSPEVQAALLTVRLRNLERHLAETKGRDTAARRRVEDAERRRAAQMRYLKRKDLPRFVEVAKALGMDPDSVVGR